MVGVVWFFYIWKLKFRKSLKMADLARQNQINHLRTLLAGVGGEMAVHMTRQNFAYQNIVEVPQDVAEASGRYVEELDLSYNRISDLRCLMPYKKLKTLVLDHNVVKSHVKIPEMPTLHTLWMNHNKIENLATFMKELSKKCPNLQILSMMNNEAAPSYFNNGTYQQYVDYRYYVISRLPKLEFLDDKKIEDSERSEAERIYKPVRKKRSKGPSEG